MEAELDYKKWLAEMPKPTQEQIRESQETRCEEQGHDWRNGMTGWLQVYMFCKWCGAKR